MCIIIHKPAGKILAREIYEECYDCNDHGAGLSYVENGKLIVDKGYFNFPKLYEEIQKREELEMVIHFRVASPGMAICKDMCHPFYSDSGNSFEYKDGEETKPRYYFAFSHNGRLPWRSTKEESDTHCFVKDIFAPMMERDPFFLEYEGKALMELAIGTRNKIVIMRYDAEEKKIDTFILNEKEGNKYEGCWFSNYSYVRWPLAQKVVSSPFGFDESDRKNFNIGFENSDPAGWYYSETNSEWTNKFTGVRCQTLSNKHLPNKKSRFSTDDPPLYHLSKSQRKQLFQITGNYCKGFPDIKGLNKEEAINMLREDVKWSFKEEVKNLFSNRDLDLWIIANEKKIKDINDYSKILNEEIQDRLTLPE